LLPWPAISQADDRDVAVGLAGGLLGLQLREGEAGRADSLEPADLVRRLRV
jgi:hypothetical protein